jgi:two-component system sensor histidine kinase YesM
VIDVTDDAYQARTLKLILQPLVENSILHGILVKRDKEGVITITGKSEGNALLITVSDDGAGMTERQALALSEAYSPGYGIRNIDQRIKLRCGSQYGLSYESSLGRGTKVTIRIAKQL